MDEQSVGAMAHFTHLQTKRGVGIVPWHVLAVEDREVGSVIHLARGAAAMPINVAECKDDVCRRLQIALRFTVDRMIVESATGATLGHVLDSVAEKCRRLIAGDVDAAMTKQLRERVTETLKEMTGHRVDKPAAVKQDSPAGKTRSVSST